MGRKIDISIYVYVYLHKYLLHLCSKNQVQKYKSNKQEDKNMLIQDNIKLNNQKQIYTGIGDYFKEVLRR